MSSRTGSSRTLGPVKQCSIIVRGGKRCVWCQIELIKAGSASVEWVEGAGLTMAGAEATIDHLDANPRNNHYTNLVGACAGCNTSRYWDWDESIGDWTLDAALMFDWFSFDEYLRGKGACLIDAIHRVEAQRWIAPSRKDGLALAEQWHPARLAYLRSKDQRRRRVIKLQDQVFAAEERAAIQSTTEDELCRFVECF